MAWQDNLLSNLLVLFILFALFVIIYCRMKNVTLLQLIKDLKEAF